jgi:hypothetical protein
MNWTYFLIGLGILALGYWSYRDVKGKPGIDEDGTPTYNYGKNWIMAICGLIGGPILMLSAIPSDISIPILLVLVLGIVIFILRWLYTFVRRVFKNKGRESASDLG